MHGLERAKGRVALGPTKKRKTHLKIFCIDQRLAAKRADEPNEIYCSARYLARGSWSIHSTRVPLCSYPSQNSGRYALAELVQAQVVCTAISSHGGQLTRFWSAQRDHKNLGELDRQIIGKPQLAKIVPDISLSDRLSFFPVFSSSNTSKYIHNLFSQFRVSLI